MLNSHLSDEQLQELAINNTSTEHVDTCKTCKIKLDNYRLLINVIEEQETPSFNFDLAAAIVAQIETPSAIRQTKGLWWLCAIPLIAITAIASVYFGDYMVTLFSGLKSLAMYLFAISIIVLAIALIIDQYKTYQKKMKLLDMQ